MLKAAAVPVALKSLLQTNTPGALYPNIDYAAGFLRLSRRLCGSQFLPKKRNEPPRRSPAVFSVAGQFVLQDFFFID